MRRKNRSAPMALCGILAAVAVAVMFLGGVLPFNTIAAPVLASLVLIPVYAECGRKWGWLWYAATAALALIIAPDKEAAILFVIFGCYPLLRVWFGRLSHRVGRWLVKLGYLNATVLLAYAAMYFLFQMEAIVEDFADMAKWMAAVMLILANLTFAVYDVLVDRVTVLYFVRLRPKLKL